MFVTVCVSVVTTRVVIVTVLVWLMTEVEVAVEVIVTSWVVVAGADDPAWLAPDPK